MRWSKLNGVAFVVTLTEDGKPVAKVEQEGSGGCGIWRWSDDRAEARFTAWVATLAPIPASEGFPEMAQDADMALEGLINDEADRKACRTKTLFHPTAMIVGERVRWVRGGIYSDLCGVVMFIREDEQRRGFGLIVNVRFDDGFRSHFWDSQLVAE